MILKKLGRNKYIIGFAYYDEYSKKSADLHHVNVNEYLSHVLTNT